MLKKIKDLLERLSSVCRKAEKIVKSLFRKSKDQAEANTELVVVANRIPVPIVVVNGILVPITMAFVFVNRDPIPIRSLVLIAKQKKEERIKKTVSEKKKSSKKEPEEASIFLALVGLALIFSAVCFIAWSIKNLWFSKNETSYIITAIHWMTVHCPAIWHLVIITAVIIVVIRHIRKY